MADNDQRDLNRSAPVKSVEPNFFFQNYNICQLLLCCCFTSTVNSYGHVGTVS